MPTFTYDHDGSTYDIDADSSDQADAKFRQHILPFGGKVADFNNKYIEPMMDELLGRTPKEGNAAREEIKKNFQQGHKPFMPDVVSGFEDSVAKGVPIAGQYTPRTDVGNQFEQNHPIASTVGNVAGAVGSTLPLSAGMAAFTKPGTLPTLVGQTGLNSALSVGDLEAGTSGKASKEDILNAVKNSALWTAGGTAVGRILSPANMKSGQQINYERVLKESRPDIEATLEQLKQGMTHLNEAGSYPVYAANTVKEAHANKLALEWHLADAKRMEAEKQIIPNIVDKMTNKFTMGALGGMLGHDFGLGVPGMALSAGVSAYAPELLGKFVPGYWHNSALQSPTGKAIMNALSGNASITDERIHHRMP